jgi:hypothetical protein
MKINPGAKLLGGLGLLALAGGSPAVQATPGATPKHVVLISVDGLHASDLANFVRAYPYSALGRLSGRGVSFPNASTTRPSDSFPGMVAQVTGGTPFSAGIYYDVTYNRALIAPPGGTDTTPGTTVAYDETIDKNLQLLNGGGDSTPNSINPAALPRDPKTLAPVYPHNYLRVNTIFEVIKAAKGRTAWSDKHPAYDIVNGPSGHGVDDLYTPEINSYVALFHDQLVDASTPNLPTGIGLDDATNRLYTTAAYDDIKVRAILHEIDGYDHTGAKKVGVPTILGMNFQAVSVGEKLTFEPKQQAGADPDPYLGLPGGYVKETPGPLLSNALFFVDVELSRIVAELNRKGLTSSTAIIISAKHGQSPINRALLTNEVLPGGSNPSNNPAVVDPATPLVDSTGTSLLAKNGDGQGEIQDDVAILWLRDESVVPTALSLLNTPANLQASQVQTVLSGDAIKALYGDPATDPRVPDMVVVSKPGVIYTHSIKKVAEHGGFSHDDTNVALLVVAPGLTPSVNTTPVKTTQIAPTILHLLGIDSGAPSASSLQAVRIENTEVLPGLGL